MSSSVLFERTLALRQGFKPLPDCRFDVKLTPMGMAQCPYFIKLEYVVSPVKYMKKN
jgi:hypothetical protein